MNGENTSRNHSRGRAMLSATGSARWIATVFGASSPTTTCSTVMIAKARTTAVAAALPAAEADPLEDRLEDVREGRLAEPAETQAGERDAELAGRQVAVDVPDLAAARARRWRARCRRAARSGSSCARASENSAATKKPFRSTRRSAPTDLDRVRQRPESVSTAGIVPEAVRRHPAEDEPHHPVAQRGLAPVAGVAAGAEAALDHPRPARGPQVVRRFGRGRRPPARPGRAPRGRGRRSRRSGRG